MTLDEHQKSELEGASLKAEIDDVAYRGTDGRPVWIGGYMPHTDDEGLKSMANWARIHYQYYLAFVERFMNRKGRVLDIGCGSGQSTAMLARYSVTAHGLDRDTKAIDFANKHNRITGATFACGKFPRALSPDERFDYIFCIETIEHVLHDEQMRFLTWALEMLTPDGMLFITTPNEQASGGAHVGIWDTEHRKKVVEHLGERAIYRGFISNIDPEAGFSDELQSHLVLVAKR
jgi:SAM-dependent methyltransferase